MYQKVSFLESLKLQTKVPTLYSIKLILTHQQQTAFENIVEKGEIARNGQFLLFQQGFLLNQIIVAPSVHIFDIISLIAAELQELKSGIQGKGLRMVG